MLYSQYLSCKAHGPPDFAGGPWWCYEVYSLFVHNSNSLYNFGHWLWLSIVTIAYDEHKIILVKF